MQTFDLVVIGAGSGGVASAKRAAMHGASVAIIEGHKYGGTCVNVGCVPKKVMYNASHVFQMVHEAKEFGIHIDGNVSLNWGELVAYRSRYIQRLNGIYEGGLDKLNITRIGGMAAFKDKSTVVVEGQEISAKHIIIAVGGTPSKLSIPGAEYLITSDGFFELKAQPKKVAVIGGGYIAAELAGVLHGLGSETLLFIRGQTLLRTFDPTISSHLKTSMEQAGLQIVQSANSTQIIKEEDGTLSLHLQDGRVSKMLLTRHICILRLDWLVCTRISDILKCMHDFSLTMILRAGG